MIYQKMVDVIKASGEKEIFDKRKISKTVLKAGASKQFADKIANKVEKKIYENIPTKKILGMGLKLLKNKPEIASRYDLKRAIMNLGPSGFPFEEFFSQILENYGYKTKVDNILRGKNITQEVDIVAERKFIYMVECKYHNALGIYTKSKVALYTYARFLDVKNSKYKFDFPWLVTNTRCSSNVIKYAKGIKMKITSWQYPKGESLQKLISDKKLYPITMLKSVRGLVKERLSQSKIMLAKSLVDSDFKELKKKTNLPDNILKKIIDEAGRLCFR